MIAYWLLFAVPALGAVFPFRTGAKIRRAGLILVAVFFVLVVGFRHQVSCDWGQYLRFYGDVGSLGFAGTLATTDTGYALLNWLSSTYSLGIYGVNVACALIFTGGLFQLSLRQPSPWLTIALAVPFMTVVVAMGFTRQAAALGWLMFALAALQDRRLIRFYLFVAFAVLFHRTAILFAILPLAMMDRSNRYALLMGSIALLSLAFFLVSEYVDYFQETYLDTYSQLQSEGALVKTSMNFVAGLAFFAYLRRWRERYEDASLWLPMAWVALAMLPLLSLSSAGVDRLGYYLLPFQIVVFSRVPLLIKSVYLRALAQPAILIAYGLVLWVWLNYSPHAQGCWVPYGSILF